MKKECFASPPTVYRPLSFWSLNGKLQTDELCRQIDSMKEAGWGGFFMHARGGLITPYMSEEWLSRLGDCVKHAKEQGMYAWLYDENCWPSGTASHTIARLAPTFRETHLFVAFDKIPHHAEDIVVAYAYRGDVSLSHIGKLYGMDDYSPPTNITPISLEDATTCPEGKRNIFIYVWRAPLSNTRFGGASYVDLMNPEATRAFVASTHEKYKAAYGDDFGKTIPGIFTDDITIKWDLYGAKTKAVAWTGSLPKQFEDMFGYSILDKLPDLFFDTDTAYATRADYIKLIGKLWAENYVGVIAKWCEENHIMLTGHLMGNEGYYSDVMYQYYLMQAPATDHLGDKCEGFRRHRRMLSVAEQFEKPYTISEIAAGAGHDMSMEKMRRLADFLGLAGVRVVSPHISQYEMFGVRKYDHPPTFSYHDPYWSEMKRMGDYHARLGYALSQGKLKADVLLLDSIESKYLTSAPGAPNKKWDEIEAQLNYTEKLLLDHHIEFAYGSEDLLERFGEVKGNTLTLGVSAYKAVVIPPALTLRKSTYALLKAFLKAGGLVVAVNNPPKYCDGRVDHPYQDVLAQMKTVSFRRLPAALANYALPLYDEDGQVCHDLHMMVRKTDDGYIYFVVNRHDSISHLATLRIPFTAKVEACNLWDGTFSLADYEAFATYTNVTLRLPKGASVLLYASPVNKPESHRLPTYHTLSKTPLCPPFALALDRPNLLFLDKFAQDECDGNYGAEQPVSAFKRKPKFSLQTHFNVLDYTGKDGYLLLECSANWEVTLNGHPLTHNGGSMFYPHLDTLPLGDALQTGKNTLCLTCKEGYRPEMQPVYLAGNFTVLQEDDTHFTVKDGLPQTILQDLTTEGLPFYLGNATLCADIDFAPEQDRRYSLSLVGMHAVLATVKVNGHDVEGIVEAPYETDITNALVSGKNHIELTLHGWLRNALGPHHMAEAPGRVKFISPGNYMNYADFTESYDCVPFGVERIYIKTLAK